MATSSLQTLLDSFEARLGAVEASLNLAPAAAGSQVAANSSPSPQASEPLAPFVTAFEEHCSNCLSPFMAASEALGGGAAASGAIVKRAWDAQRDFLIMASKCKKPDMKALMSVLGPIQQCMKDAGAAVKRDDWERHAKTVSEGLACLNWVAVAPPAGLPKDIVDSSVGGQDYWANKVWGGMIRQLSLARKDKSCPERLC